MFSASLVSRRILQRACHSNVFLLQKQSSRWMSDLPYHLVVGMPALSPTMEAGVIAEWKVAEGDSFVAGDALAEIETDKASIDFEAQDDGVVAKLLVEAGKGDVPVNQPIMVTVEEESDVAAFKDFVVEAATPPTPAATESAPAPEPVAASTPAPTPAPVAATPVETPVAVVPDPVIITETPPPVVASDAATMSPVWGTMAKTTSPIAKIMIASQKKYIDQYGSTGQVPL